MKRAGWVTVTVMVALGQEHLDEVFLMSHGGRQGRGKLGYIFPEQLICSLPIRAMSLLDVFV